MNKLSPKLSVTALAIADLALLTPTKHEDRRGFFSETYNQAEFARIGIDARFVQDNHSHSDRKGTVRGLHFQTPPRAQEKLVRVCRGAILAVAVDIRNGSATYGRHISVILSADNWSQLWMPKGFAHGYCTLEPGTEVIYKVTHIYAPQNYKGLAWNDPALGIEWPVAPQDAIVSDADARHPRLAELPKYFHYRTRKSASGSRGMT